MTDDLDVRLRAGLAELAEPGDVDVDGAPDRVRDRIEKRRHRRQRNVAFVSIVTLAFVMTTAQLVSWQDSPGRRVVSVSPTTQQTNPKARAAVKKRHATPKVVVDAHGHRITVSGSNSATSSTGSQNTSTGPSKSSTLTNVGSGTSPGNAPGQQPNVPPTTVGATGPPVSVQPGGGSAFPGASPTHLVVVLDDVGLHSSSALMDAGTIAVTFLDRRASQPNNVSISSTDATINVGRDSTDSYTLRTPETYTLGVNGGSTNFVSFDIGVPANAGGSTDPAGEINVTEAGGLLTFPNRDTIEDVITLPDVPAGVPIVYLKAGSYALNFNNTDKDRQRVVLTVASINITVPRHKTVSATGDIPAGIYQLQSTNSRTHAVTTVYLYVVP